MRGGGETGRLPGEAGSAAGGRSICPDSDPGRVRTGDSPYPGGSTEVGPIQVYWPEGNIKWDVGVPGGGNVLIPRRADPISGEPDYNAVERVERVERVG